MTLSYDLPVAGAVDVRIFDMRGHEVRHLLQVEQGAGQQSVFWNGKDSGDRDVASGVYFARIGFVGGGQEESLVRKVLVTR